MRSVHQKADFLNLIALKTLCALDFRQFTANSYYSEVELDRRLEDFNVSQNDVEDLLLSDLKNFISIKDEHYRKILLSRHYDTCVNSLINYAENNDWDTLEKQNQTQADNFSKLKTLVLEQFLLRLAQSAPDAARSFEILAINELSKRLPEYELKKEYRIDNKVADALFVPLPDFSAKPEIVVDVKTTDIKSAMQLETYRNRLESIRSKINDSTALSLLIVPRIARASLEKKEKFRNFFVGTYSIVDNTLDIAELLDTLER